MLPRSSSLGSKDAVANVHWSVDKAPLWHRARVRVRRWPAMLVLVLMTLALGHYLHATSNSLALAPAGPRQPSSEALEQSTRVRLLRRLLEERYPDLNGYKAPRVANYPALEHLATCLETDTCAPAERKIILLASPHFLMSEGGRNGGEDVWARSLIAALRHLNHTILFAWGHADALMVYQALPELVSHVLWEGSNFRQCVNGTTTRGEANPEPSGWRNGSLECIQTEAYPQGIPYWKSFLFHFWAGSSDHPLGNRWVITPEDYDTLYTNNKPNTTYLGYSIEKRCAMYPTFSDREHRALILAKRPEYFEEGKNAFHGILDDARATVPPARENGNGPFQLITTAGSAGDVIPGIGTSLGNSDQKEWTALLARSKALLGIGQPPLSPSPYYALCMGVPFINPVLRWDQKDPDNRDKWQVQQGGMTHIREPHVYHVHKGDKEGLGRALRLAASTPIQPYILPNMRFEAVVDRVRSFVEKDWHTEAKAWVAERLGNASEWQHLAMDG